MSCTFRLSEINDEISADFDHACSVAANEFGLPWIELRSMRNKNVTELNADEVDKSHQILEKCKLHVTDISRGRASNALVETGCRSAIAGHMVNLAYRRKARITLEEAMNVPADDRI